MENSVIGRTGAPNAEELGFSPERLQRLDDRLQEQIDGGQFAGFSVLIVRHGRTVSDRCFGYHDIASRQPLRADAIYRIASMTKPIAAAALMILFEEGRWQLDDPVARFAPEFAELKVADGDKLVPLDHPITMREVLTSTAGFAAGHAFGSSNPGVDQRYAAARLQDGTLADMAAKLSGLPLETQPGTKFRYGIQHDIQGFLVERLSGQGLDTFLEDRLFRPLGMTDTGFGVEPAKRGRIAPLYAYDAEGGLVRAAHQGSFHAPGIGEKPRFLAGSLGLYSTTCDFARFAGMLARGGSLDGRRILAPSTVALMMSDMLPEGVKIGSLRPIEAMGYGAGLGIALDPARVTFNSGGIGKGSVFWTGAHGSWFWIDPVNDLIVVGMVQQERSGAAHMGIPTEAPDLRALTRSLVYAALVEPER